VFPLLGAAAHRSSSWSSTSLLLTVDFLMCWHRYGEATSPTKPNIGACLD
jgi:hypothetical protein